MKKTEKKEKKKERKKKKRTQTNSMSFDDNLCSGMVSPLVNTKEH